MKKIILSLILVSLGAMYGINATTSKCNSEVESSTYASAAQDIRVCQIIPGYDDVKWIDAKIYLDQRIIVIRGKAYEYKSYTNGYGKTADFNHVTIGGNYYFNL